VKALKLKRRWSPGFVRQGMEGKSTKAPKKVETEEHLKMRLPKAQKYVVEEVVEK